MLRAFPGLARLTFPNRATISFIPRQRGLPPAVFYRDDAPPPRAISYSFFGPCFLAPRVPPLFSPLASSRRALGLPREPARRRHFSEPEIELERETISITPGGVLTRSLSALDGVAALQPSAISGKFGGWPDSCGGYWRFDTHCVYNYCWRISY